MIKNKSYTTPKGTKIDALARVARKDTACIGTMAWETPYIVFKTLLDGAEYRWHSERAAPLYWDIEVGDEVAIEAFAYGRALRRVKVSFRGRSYGMRS